MTSKINVLVSLHKGYGLGDGTQMSAVLRHIRKYRLNWRVDYQAEVGKEKAGVGIVDNVFVYGEPYPTPHYDAEVLICLYDTLANWGDRPNTRVSSCLHEHFGLGWDAECGRYEINVRPEARTLALQLIECVKPQYCEDHPIVVIHHQGDSVPTRKDLTETQSEQICRFVEGLDGVPLLLDWRGRSRLPFANISKGSTHQLGHDAEINTALIAQCHAFIGIDSGPGKCASATATPTLIVWTGHHPAVYHDPAPNTTHLVPDGYRGLEPVVSDPDTMRWFENHYDVMYYIDDPMPEIKKWLRWRLL